MQRLLGYPQPSYAHIPLLTAPDGRRLSKRDRDLDMEGLRERFGSSEALLGWLAGQTGLADDCSPRSPSEIVESFSWDRIRTRRDDMVVDLYLPLY